MAFIAPAFAAAGTAAAGTAAAGAAAASTAATVAAAGSFVSTATTILSGIATVGSILASMQAARAEQAAGQAAANEARLQGEIATIEGAQEANASESRAVEIRREALRKSASARVAFGASGIDISSNQLAAVEGEIDNDAGYQLEIEKANKRRSIAAASLRGAQFGAQADNAILGASYRSGAARVGAFTTGAEGLLKIIKRG